MILLDRVTKVYSKKARALDRISLQVESGEFVTIVGTSGAGKSTLFKLLTKEERPSSGKIVVGGIDYSELPDRKIPLLRRRIGTIFQDFKLLPNRTVSENVAIALEITGHSNREIKRVVPKVLELVGIADKKDNFPQELSGGEQQRVAIARAIVQRPKVLIADEPTGNLDPKHVSDVVDVLEKLNKQGTTVLMITHNTDIIRKMRHRVVKIEGGRVVGDRMSKISKRKEPIQ